MLAIQIFLWIFMLEGFLSMHSDKVTQKAPAFFVWFISLLLLIATKVFL